MGDDQRVRRPALDRTTPHRTWTNVIFPGPPVENQSNAEMQNWYRVLDEQLRAGQASARLMQEALAKASSGDSQDLVNRMVRAGSDFMGFWLEFLTRSAAGMAPAAERAVATSGQPAAPSEPSPAIPLRVTVEVDSARPAKVAVDLRPEARGSRLCLDRLHPRDSNAPPMGTVKIDTSAGDDLVLIRLRIEPDQPAGVYDGVIVNEVTSLPAGTISVEVLGVRDRVGTESPQ